MVGTCARTAGALGVAGVLAGCGIRSTTVPVDAGPAPVRASCAVPQVAGAAPGRQLRSVYLVCSMQVTPVWRSVPVGADAPTLLAQLHRSPLAAESQAGFSTEVPGSLTITGPQRGDPPDALRLSQPLDELPSYALAQLVCTLADPDPSVPARILHLAGPDPTSRTRAYTCTPDLRTNPDAGETAGDPTG